ncbi:MAG: HAD family phosphatase [Verrucomicrobia bacterium]|nr:HAD family phosphatase [Verrucomicrobiota bacterium]
MSLKVQLISTDFDGTLHADFESPPVPRRLENQIAELQSQGARWLINTGRDLSSLMESLARARLSIWPDFLGLVEREIYARVGHEYHPLGTWNADCAREDSQLFERIIPDVPRLIEWIDARYQATLYEDPFSPLCLIASNNDEADRILEYLQAYCDTVADLTVVRNDIYARFSHARYHKGAVVAEVARRLNIPRSAIFAAGDHLNDLPMLDGSCASMIAAPGNAVPQVRELLKKAGGFQSEKPCGHGVAEALEFFLQDKSSRRPV